MERPPLWWPWRHGAQPRVHVEVRVEVDGVRSDHRRLTTAFRDVTVRDWQWWVNGEPIFVMGANHGPTRMALADATREELARDVELAKLANLDLLRVHAHVTRPEFYEAADAAGLLLWQDFPLQWGYSRGARKQAARQARKMVDRLGHHPSIGIWCAHNEPLAVDFQPGEPVAPKAAARVGASMFLPSWNKDVLDRSVSHAIHRADPTRTVVVHSGVFPGVGSGGTDSHLYFGWYHGQMDGLAPALAPLPAARRASCPSSARRRCRRRPTSWRPSGGRTSTGTTSSSTTRARSGCSTGTCRPRCSTRSRRGSSRPSGTRPRSSSCRSRTSAGCAGPPPAGSASSASPTATPAVTWSVLDHARVPKVGLRGAAELVPQRAADARAPPRAGARGERDPHRVRRAPSWRSRSTAGGRRFTGDLAAGAVTFIGPVHLDHRTGEVALTLTHPALGTVEHRYDDVLDWLRIVNDR